MENYPDSSKNYFSNLEKTSYDSLSYLYLSLPITLVWQWISAIFLSIVIFDSVDKYALGIWLLLSTVVFFYRYYHFHLFQKSNKVKILKEIKIWKHRFFADTLISGVLWGSTAILIFPHIPSFQIILVLFMFMASFIAMTNLASNFQLLLLYCLITFVPLISRLLFSTIGDFTNFGLVVIALMIIMVLISKYFGSVVNTSIKDHQNYLDIKHSHEVLQERFFALFERAPVGIVYFNKELKIQDCNKKFIELNEKNDKNILLGQNLAENSNQELTQSYRMVFQNKIGDYRGPATAILGDKQLYLDLNTVPLLNNNNEISGGIAILKDITEEISAKEKVIRNAYYDMLTNIPNRTLFMDNLNNAHNLAKANKFYGSVLYLDIDNFKKINETFGHEKGDQALKQVATRILQLMDENDIFARIGGDKFAILVPKLDDNMDVSSRLILKYAKKIQSIFSSPFYILSEEFYITVSIGIYIFPAHNSQENSYDILKCSEIAMYESKKIGKNSITFYQENMSNDIQEYTTINRELRQALSNNELMMFYHPQTNVQDGSICSAEALIRWKHPKKGSISPSIFIPIAEESGYIIELSHWIIEQTIKDIKMLTSANNDLPIKHIAININSMHFLSPSFEDEIKILIEKYKVPAKYIELEITEGVVMQNINEAIKKMNALKEFGFKMSMDDFGTGYSSLSYLSKLPFNSLKVDQAFVRDMAENESDRKLVYSIIELAKNFNMEVVAEGLETKEALDLLRKTECDTYQGFYNYKPMAFKEFRLLFENQDTDLHKS